MAIIEKTIIEINILVVEEEEIMSTPTTKPNETTIINLHNPFKNLPRNFRELNTPKKS